MAIQLTKLISKWAILFSSANNFARYKMSYFTQLSEKINLQESKLSYQIMRVSKLSKKHVTLTNLLVIEPIINWTLCGHIRGWTH